jgi:hypothetical protein
VLHYFIANKSFAVIVHKFEMAKKYTRAFVTARSWIKSNQVLACIVDGRFISIFSRKKGSNGPNDVSSGKALPSAVILTNMQQKS